MAEQVGRRAFGISQARRHRDRAQQFGVGRSFTASEWQALCAHYDSCCLCCGARAPLTVDHIIPLSLGSCGTIDNIQPLCVDCNCRKGRQIISYRRDHPMPRPAPFGLEARIRTVVRRCLLVVAEALAW